MTDLLARFKDVTPNGSGWTALCTAHRHNSLRIGRREGCWQHVRFFRETSGSCAETLT